MAALPRWLLLLLLLVVAASHGAAADERSGSSSPLVGEERSYHIPFKRHAFHHHAHARAHAHGAEASSAEVVEAGSESESEADASSSSTDVNEAPATLRAELEQRFAARAAQASSAWLNAAAGVTTDMNAEAGALPALEFPSLRVSASTPMEPLPATFNLAAGSSHSHTSHHHRHHRLLRSAHEHHHAMSSAAATAAPSDSEAGSASVNGDGDGGSTGGGGSDSDSDSDSSDTDATDDDPKGAAEDRAHRTAPPPVPTRFPLRNHFSVVYMGYLTVGTPGHAYRVVFDTGSSDLWLRSAHLGALRPVNGPPAATSPAGAVHEPFLRYYDSNRSTTYTPVGRPWHIQYGEGTCTGFLSRDSVRLGDLEAHHQMFAEATITTPNFIKEQLPIDGILGFGFAGASQCQCPTLLDSLFASNQIRQRMFSFYLTTSDGPNADDSVLILGAPDPKLYHPQFGLTWTSVLPMSGPPPLAGAYGSSNAPPIGPATGGPTSLPRMWFVHLERVMIGNQVLSMCGAGGTRPCVALPDTGTSLLTLPSRRWQHVIDLLTDGRPDCTISEQKIVYCSGGSAGMRSISFQFEGQLFTLRPEDYMLYNYIVGIQCMDMGSGGGAEPLTDLVVLGDPFLRAVYTVFDMDRARVGFANARAVRSSVSTQNTNSGAAGWMEQIDEWMAIPTVFWSCIGVVAIAFALFLWNTCCAPSLTGSSAEGYPGAGGERNVLLPLPRARPIRALSMPGPARAAPVEYGSTRSRDADYV